VHNADQPWGDYGDALAYGGAYGKEGHEELLIERTGPWVPPIYKSGDWMVVTESLKKKLESSGLAGLSFGPAKLAKVVDIRWREWDLAGEEPAFYPESGEPGDFIEKGDHAPELVSQMEILHELKVERGGVCDGDSNIVESTAELFLRRETLTGLDLFRADGVLHIFASQRARDWLWQHAAGALRFEEIRVE
jgi:hypothetical protein